MKPFILISPSFDNSISKYTLNKFYTEAIVKSGGIPLIVPYESISYIDEILDKVDGIVLSGGGDIHARFFNEELDEKASFIYEFRDEFEIKLCQNALERDMPIFCICRGVQLLNVAIGGTLKQHIDGHVNATDDLTHKIDVVPNSYFTELFGKESFVVNSIHHQALRDISENVEVLAYSNDIIEAIRLKDKKFVVGVQYHPERTYENVESKKLFDAFVDECKNK